MFFVHPSLSLSLFLFLFTLPMKCGRHCVSLAYLSLAHCTHFTSRGLQSIMAGKGCRKLTYLDLSGCIQVQIRLPELGSATQSTYSIPSISLSLSHTHTLSCFHPAESGRIDVCWAGLPHTPYTALE